MKAVRCTALQSRRPTRGVALGTGGCLQWGTAGSRTCLLRPATSAAGAIAPAGRIRQSPPTKRWPLRGDHRLPYSAPSGRVSATMGRFGAELAVLQNHHSLSLVHVRRFLPRHLMPPPMPYCRVKEVPGFESRRYPVFTAGLPLTPALSPLDRSRSGSPFDAGRGGRFSRGALVR